MWPFRFQCLRDWTEISPKMDLWPCLIENISSFMVGFSIVMLVFLGGAGYIFWAHVRGKENMSHVFFKRCLDVYGLINDVISVWRHCVELLLPDFCGIFGKEDQIVGKTVLKSYNNIVSPKKNIPSLPNTLSVGVWTHRHPPRRPLAGPNTYS